MRRLAASRAFYYAFGKTDIFVIADVPDNVFSRQHSPDGERLPGCDNRVTVLLTPRRSTPATKKRPQ